MSTYSRDYIKQRTLEIYKSMPQNKEQRKACLKERDEIIELNYTFFGYIASHTFINNPSVTYEDKLQSALMHFCECFWWYMWEGDETHKGYRTDLAWTVFFKPRIGEMIERELNEVKYSIRRSLCMKAGAQLGKHWAQVRYEDLDKVNLPPEEMASLKSMFGTMYWADLSEHELYIPAPTERESEFANPSDNYNTVEELLIHEMVVEEKKLTDSDLLQIADMYGLDYYELKRKLPECEATLYKRLKDSLDLYNMD